MIVLDGAGIGALPDAVLYGDEASTRELIVRENQRYARRQLIWFRKEPNLQWIQVDNDPTLTFIQSKQIIHALED
jgi:tRNA A37 N6-isopentenylltransferase MiaA